MTFHRTAIAAAVFLIVTYLKLFLPAYDANVEPRLWALMERNSIVLSLPESVTSWLDLS